MCQRSDRCRRARPWASRRLSDKQRLCRPVLQRALNAELPRYGRTGRGRGIARLSPDSRRSSQKLPLSHLRRPARRCLQPTLRLARLWPARCCGDAVCRDRADRHPRFHQFRDRRFARGKTSIRTVSDLWVERRQGRGGRLKITLEILRPTASSTTWSAQPRRHAGRGGQGAQSGRIGPPPFWPPAIAAPPARPRRRRACFWSAWSMK